MKVDSVWIDGRISRLRPAPCRAARLSPAVAWLAGVLLGLFALGMVLQTGMSWLPQANRVLGMALMALYALLFFEKRLCVPAEVLLFGAFIAWGAVTGLLFAVDGSLVMAYVRLLVQIWGLAWAVAGLSALRHDADIAFFSLVLAASAVVAYGFLTGDFALVAESSGLQRSSSLLSNPNDLAFCSFLGITGLLYFWKRSRTRVGQLGIVSAIVALALAVVYSGSRKAFLGLLVLAVAWLYFCYGQQLRTNPRYLALSVAVLAGLYLLLNYALNSTVMGVRLQASMVDGGLDAERQTLYREGLMHFQESPIAGIGLGNFAAHSWFGEYSHSDYMEALSTTGIVGFGLYFSIYPLLWLRLRRIRAHESNPQVRYDVGLFRAFLVTLLCLAVGRINFLSVLTWVALAGIIGYASALALGSTTTVAKPPTPLAQDKGD